MFLSSLYVPLISRTVGCDGYSRLFLSIVLYYVRPFIWVTESNICFDCSVEELQQIIGDRLQCAKLHPECNRKYLPILMYYFHLTCTT